MRRTRTDCFIPDTILVECDLDRFAHALTKPLWIARYVCLHPQNGTHRLVNQSFADFNRVLCRIGSIYRSPVLPLGLRPVSWSESCVQVDAEQCQSLWELMRANTTYLCTSTLSTNSSNTTPSQWFMPVSPHPTKMTPGSTSRMACAHCRAFVAYAEAVCCPTCHSPHTSFPRPQYFTPYASSSPVCFRRRLA